MPTGDGVPDILRRRRPAPARHGRRSSPGPSCWCWPGRGRPPGSSAPPFLALVLTITVHPVRRALVRRNVPEWLVAVAVVVSVYLLLISVSVALLVSAGRLAQLLPQYKDEFDTYTAERGRAG